MTDNYYSEYVTAREPNPRSSGLISRWHFRLFTKALKDLELTRPLRVLEVGAGHGQLAAELKSHGHEYEFVDLSPAVYEQMSRKGFVGFCGALASAPDSMSGYDVIWLSHVLEHCESPTIAARLLADAASRCAHTGAVVVISPDASSSKWEFFGSDWSHGFPTTRRNVTQLCREASLEVLSSRFHRGGRFLWMSRLPFRLVSMIPTFPVDAVLSRRRLKQGEGFFYSWKTILGWRQLYVVARRHQEQ